MHKPAAPGSAPQRCVRATADEPVPSRAMREVEIGSLRTSVIGLGTWQFGSREWGYGEEYATTTAPALVRRARELGVTFIDTAEIYGFGRSERILGAAVGPDRDGLVLATKLMPILPIPAYTVSRAERSRERLGVPVIDLYQAHWPNPLVPLGTTMAGFRRLVDRGVVREVGVSNYSLERWRAAERALGMPVVSNQVRFNLATPGPLRDLIPYARDHGRIVIAYSPLGQGLLVRDPAATMPRLPARRIGSLARRHGQGVTAPLVAALDEIALAHAATRAQIALAWVVAHGNVIAIPGARTLEQLEQNAVAGSIELTPDERDRLTEEAERLEAALRR